MLADIKVILISCVTFNILFLPFTAALSITVIGLKITGNLIYALLQIGEGVSHQTASRRRIHQREPPLGPKAFER